MVELCGVLRDREQRRDETRAQLFVADGEDFLELIDEEEPLVALALQRVDEFGRRLRLRVGQLARLRLAEPGAYAAQLRSDSNGFTSGTKVK